MKSYCFLILLSCFSLSLLATTPDWSAYAGTENLTAPSVEALAEKLTAKRDGDLEKAAAIFYWVTHNVAYDTKGATRMIRGGVKSETLTLDEIAARKEAQVQQAFKKGKGVCQNYARLFRRLAVAAGLEAEFIGGHSRGNAMQPGSMGFGHAWNAVKIDGIWGLVDATWGAGHVDGKGRFQAIFKPQYFLPPAGSIAFSHFPDDAEWQLLDTPISQEDFLDQPAIGPAFLEYGISDLSHTTTKLQLPRNQVLDLVFTSEQEPEQLACANLTVSKAIPCTVTEAEGTYTVSVPAKQVRNMVFGVFAGKQLLVSYRLSVR